MTQLSTSRDDEAREQQFNERARAEGILTVKVPAHYREHVEEEVAAIGAHGPLSRCVMPTPMRFDTRAPGEKGDFVDDRAHMPLGAAAGIVQKYADRLLFFPTETCLGHCQYCFRADVLADGEVQGLATLEDRLDLLSSYLARNKEVKEVILSGGDPLSLPLANLKHIFERIRAASESLRIRIHTRAAIYSPHVFSNAHTGVLAAARVRLVHHTVHPYELCEEVRDVIDRLAHAGVRQYNQLPVLSGVNDHADVLQRLLTDLDELGVRTLSLFIPDPIKYSAIFRMRLGRLCGIIDELNWRTPSWVNATRLVLDTPKGKVRREDIRSWDDGNGNVTFERDGERVLYPDLPEHLDHPGIREILLWKDADRPTTSVNPPPT